VAPVVASTTVVGTVLVNCVAAPVNVAVPVIALPASVNIITAALSTPVTSPAPVTGPVCVTAPLAVRLALPTLSVPRLVAAALVVNVLVSLPLTLFPTRRSSDLVAPVVASTTVVGTVLVNCVAAPVNVAVPVIALPASV